MGSITSPPPVLNVGLPAESWVSVEHVAAHLGVRKDSIYRWIEHRGLPARRIGKLWKLKLSEVDAWVIGEAGEPPGRADQAPRAISGSIMVVDDDETVRATLGDFLSDQGHDALLAADGMEALHLLRSGAQRPVLIILDLGMPNMDGWRLREELARDPSLSAIPIIVVTAERRRAEFSDGTVMLKKPLDLDDLTAAIGRVVERNR
jgi:excisionase family DNA binding protein